MKTLGYVVGVVFLASGLIAVGWWLGFRERVLTEAHSIATVDKVLLEAAVTGMLIEQIDSGRAGDARKHLSLQLAGNILVLDSLLEAGDKRTHELAKKVFARIAACRASHQETGAKTPVEYPEIDANIASILARAERAPSR